MTGLDLIWRGTALLAAAMVAAYVLRRASAAARHLVWTCAFAALLLLPAAMGWAPKLAVPALPASPAAVTAAASTAPAAMADTSVVVRERRTPWMVLAYLAGLLLVSLRFVLGAVRTARMVRGATPAAYAGSASESLRRQLSIRGNVRVLESAAAVVPMTWGVLHPVVILPAGTAEWPPERLHAVVLHELVHVRRHDLLAQVLGQAACCLYWFHPLVWFGAGQLRKERERACDDAVLGGGVAPVEYAGHMLALARAMVARRNSLVDAPAMAEAGDLEARVREVLDAKRNRTPLTRRMGACVAAMTVVLVLAMSAVNLVPAQAAAAVQQAAPAAPKATAPAAVSPVDIPVRGFKRPPLLLARAAAPEEQAPAATGSLAGIVRDPSGARVPGCGISIKKLDGTTQQTAKADAVGAYGFQQLPPGPYLLEARQPGFRLAGMEVQVSATDATHADLNLAVGNVSESLTVKATRPAAGAVAPAAPAAPMPPQRIPIGGNVQAAKLLRQPRPVYPEELKAQGITGVVKIRMIISKTGEPLNPEVLSTNVNPGLIQAAMEAVKRWRYQPTLLNGQPIEVITTIDVTFELEQ